MDRCESEPVVSYPSKGFCDYRLCGIHDHDRHDRSDGLAQPEDGVRQALPDVARGEPKRLLEPATVTDRTDPQLVHLDGLNLSRARCMRSIAASLPEEDPARKVLLASAAAHAAAALPHVTSGDYAGEHWLASFATWLLPAALDP